MKLFSSAERRFALAISKLAYANPFLPERIESEREARIGPGREPSPMAPDREPDRDEEQKRGNRRRRLREETEREMVIEPRGAQP